MNLAVVTDEVDEALRAAFLAQFSDIGFPVCPVKGRDFHACNGSGVDAASVHAESIGMGAWHIERFNAAMFAEEVLGRAGVEGVCSQRVFPLQKAKARLRDDKV
jgi:hypothetical protein